VKTDEIRSTYLEFFQSRDHVVARSDKIVPGNDPSLLFTSAGMVQFKPFYTGEVAVPYRRATTSQKCLRAGGKANDLDEVGKTSRHLTFFEMLGNFSFGDYFKREAIAWAWEFSTELLKIPGDRIVVSVFEDDDEAFGIWEKEIGIPTSRIFRMGTKDNFWGPAGDTGACGPCSELHYDKGESVDPNATLENDPHERFMEFWNLVFPQFDQQLDGSRPPLQNRGIDTGMGLERLAALLQNKATVFDIDLMAPILAHTADLSGRAYDDTPVPFRVIADHIRALSFMIADGILPGNEGRGYVQRRLLRRAARFGRELGLEKPFLHEVAGTVIEIMGGQYPELHERRKQIGQVIRIEEERFASTLARGMDLLDDIFGKLEAGSQVPGEDLFRLHDTFGFPLDLATDIAEDRGYRVDREGFDAAMARQKEAARGAWKGSGESAIAPVYRKILEESGPTKFVGYDGLECDATIVAIVKDGQRVDALAADEQGEVVLDATPFYANAGGQVGDTGTLEAREATAHVTDCQSPVEGLRVHYANGATGSLRVGDSIHAAVNAELRAKTAAHHTGTHLLQAALQEILGDHVHQAGSLVAPERLRFDFTHFEGVDRERLLDIERLVNEFIRADYPIVTREMPLDEARALGAMALFGEKYGDVVRVVEAGEVSRELCGGTHVPSTGAIGYFKVVGESSIAAGVRRIEAVAADQAVAWTQAQERALSGAAQLLNTPPEQVAERLQAVLEENKRLQREVNKWKQAAATGSGTDYMDRVQEVGGIRVLASEVPGQDPAGLRSVLDQLREKLGSGVVILGSGSDGKAALAIAVSKDLTGRIKAGDLVKRLAPMVGGGGGGRPDMAQAGGKNPEKLPEAIAQATAVVAELLQ